MVSTLRQDGTPELPRLSRRVAMYHDAATDAWLSVHADEYDPDIHKNLKCGDPACFAGAVHVDRHYAEGSRTVLSHFATKADQRQNHIQGCRWLAPEQELHGNRVTLQEAVAGNFKVVINLNWPLGNPLFNSFARATDINVMGTHYNIFRANNAHATVRARSIDEFYEMIETIKAEEKKALATNKMLPPVMPRVVVSHAHDIRYVDNFIVNASPSKFKDLIGEMENRGVLHAQFNRLDVQGFPLDFRFEASQEERKHPDAPGTIVDGKAIMIKACGNGKLFVINKLKSDDPSFRQKMLEYDAYDVFAMPILLMADLHAAKEAFNAGRKGYIPLYWQVNTDAQYRPAPKAGRIPKPQPGLGLF